TLFRSPESAETTGRIAARLTDLTAEVLKKKPELTPLPLNTSLPRAGLLVVLPLPPTRWRLSIWTSR
ncbi:hypothetical protein RZS08_49350, partial [Arthrospira platensis SPKY1]|nr:hypothetical protein [Arthrospira platensis SPKY1]